MAKIPYSKLALFSIGHKKNLRKIFPPYFSLAITNNAEASMYSKKWGPGGDGVGRHEDIWESVSDP